MLQPELKVIGGKQQGTKIALPVGKFLIGREEDCHLRPNSELVSRHHCVFTTDEFSLRLRDLGSTNGTLVNGERIRGTILLNAGDKVCVGKLDFEVVLNDSNAPAAADPQAANEFNLTEAASQETSTTIASTSETMTEIPTAAAEAFLHTDETVVAPQPPMHQPMMAYPPQYMQMPYGYPGYAPMPYYPQQMGYPQMPMPGYPGMPMPGQPGYPPQQPPPEDADSGSSSAAQETRLPDPSETGAKEPEAPAGGGDSKAGGPTVRDTATDIIKQYLQRRPTTNK